MACVRTTLILAAVLAVGASLRRPGPVEAAPPIENSEVPKLPPDPRLIPGFWGEPLEIGTLGNQYSRFHGLSPDGSRMLVHHQNELYCVHIGEGRTLWTIEAKGLSIAAWSPDGKSIAAAQWENGANLYDAGTGRTIAPFFVAGGSGERPGSIGFLPDGRIVVHTSAWSYQILKDEPALADGSPKIRNSMRFSLIVWDPTTKKEVRRTTQELVYGNLNKWQWLSGGSNVLQTWSGYSENGVTTRQTLSQMDPLTGKATAEIEIDKLDERSYDTSPDGRRVLLAKGLEGARLVEVATGKVIQKLGGHKAFMTAAAFSPDGRLIATVSGTQRPRASFAVPPDGPAELLIRDAASGEVAVRFEFQPSKYDFTAVGFSGNGRMLFAVTKQNKIVVWGKFPFGRPDAKSGAFGLPNLPEPPEVEPFTGRIPGVLHPAKPGPDTLNSLCESLPKSGRTTAQMIDVLFAATLGRLPTDVESKPLQTQLGAKPTAESLKKVATALAGTPEFLKHVNTLINRVNGKDKPNVDLLQPRFGPP